MEIPNFSRYTIDETGKVFDKKLQREIKPYIAAGYKSVTLQQKHGLVHRLVALTYIPNSDNLPFVDHIDRNKLNNHVSNLRWVTKTENSQNHGPSRSNTSGFENVVWNEKKHWWRASRMINHKHIHIGVFKTKEEAHDAVEKFKETGEVSHKELKSDNTSGYRNIIQLKSGKWQFRLSTKALKHKKVFQTLEEAIEYRDNNLFI